MMKTKTGEYSAIPPWEMTRMETRLEAALHGVKPRPDFVSNLRTRLNHEPVRTRSTAEVLQYAIISVAGLAGAIVLVVAGIKAMVALLSVLGILNQVGQSRNDAPQASA